MRVFLLSGNAEGGIYKLSQKERRYLFSVLRLNVNDVFTAKDKNGNFYKAFLFSEDSMTLERTDDPESGGKRLAEAAAVPGQMGSRALAIWK